MLKQRSELTQVIIFIEEMILQSWLGSENRKKTCYLSEITEIHFPFSLQTCLIKLILKFKLF